jgi:Fibronectin type III domain
MKIMNRYFASVLAMTLTLMACGGGGGSSPAGGSAAVTGKFVDATVAGLGYKCGTSATLNTTNASGQFTCPSDQSVSFYVGDILLGLVSTPQGIVTPLDLVGSGASPSNIRVANTVRFLMSLSTTDPASGTITLDAAAVAAAAGKSVDFAAITTAALDTMITTLRPSATVYTEAQATTHLQSSINGLFAGNYSGTFSGGSSGNWTAAIDGNGVVTGAIDGEPGTVLGNIVTTPSTPSNFAFSGTGNGIPWSGTLNVSTRVFSGTWSDGPSNNGTFTGQGSASTGSGTGTGGAGATVPSQPTGLSADATSASQIQLNWATVAGATGYNIYRSTAASVVINAANKITASPVTPTSYSSTGLSAATTYYYKITAVNAAGESLGSAEVSATTSAASTGGGSGSGSGITLSAPFNGVSSIASTPVSQTLSGGITLLGFGGSGALLVSHQTVSGYEVLQVNIGPVGSTSSLSTGAVGNGFTGNCALAANPFSVPTCISLGMTFNRSAGTVSFASTPMSNGLSQAGATIYSITGNLTFTPF